MPFVLNVTFFMYFFWIAEIYPNYSEWVLAIITVDARIAIRGILFITLTIFVAF